MRCSAAYREPDAQSGCYGVNAVSVQWAASAHALHARSSQRRRRRQCEIKQAVFRKKVKVVVAEEAGVRNIRPLRERIFEKAWNINYRLSPGMYEIFLNAEGTYYLGLICRKVRPMITIQSR